MDLSTDFFNKLNFTLENNIPFEDIDFTKHFTPTKYCAINDFIIGILPKGLGKVEACVSFNQNELIRGNKLNSELRKYNAKYNGLCELICNHVLICDLLGKGDVKGSFLKKNIKVENLNSNRIKNSHILQVYSLFQKIIAFIFSIYPNNIFSIKDQWKLVYKKSEEYLVDASLLKKGLLRVENNEVLKVQIFKKNGLEFSGHALLIKKIDHDNYTFFDPNCGELRNLTFEDIESKLNEQLQIHKGQDIFISTKTSFIKTLAEKRILDLSKNYNDYKTISSFL